MYFKPFLIDKIVADKKTMTRRLAKLGERYQPDYALGGELGYAPAVLTPKLHVKWLVGQDYAVCPGRGRPVAWYCGANVITEERQYTPGSVMAMAIGGFVPLRIRITAIRQEDSRLISEEDARAEGFEHRWQFWQTWCEINDPAALRQKIALFVVGEITDDAKDGIMQAHMKDRPSSKYDSWAIKFKREG